MDINTSEIQYLIQENITNVQEMEKCIDDCEVEKFDMYDQKVREIYNQKNINERIDYLSYIIEQLEDISQEFSQEINALERIGAIIWVCIYEELYNMVEFDYVSPTMRKLDNYKILEKYAIDNFKHNSKLYMMICVAAQDFNFISDETRRTKIINLSDDDLVGRCVKHSITNVRKYIREKKIKEIAEALLDTRIVKYLVDLEEEKPTAADTEKKLVSVYNNLLNKNQTKSVLNTVNILFNKTKDVDRLKNAQELSNLQQLISVLVKIEKNIKLKQVADSENIEEEFVKDIEYFFNLLEEYLNNKAYIKNKVKVSLMIIEGLSKNKETNFHKNAIFLTQMHQYINTKNIFDEPCDMSEFKEKDCIQMIKDYYSTELKSKNPSDNSRTTINRLYNNRKELLQAKYIFSSTKYILNHIVDHLIKNYIEIQIEKNIENTYYTHHEDNELIKSMEINTLLEKFNLSDLNQALVDEVLKYFKKIRNYQITAEEVKYENFENDYAELTLDKLRVIKRYLLDSDKKTIDTVTNFIELVFWMDHHWWGIRNMRHSILLSTYTDEIVMRFLLNTKKSVECYKEDNKLYIAKESFYLYIIMLQSLMQMSYFATTKDTNILIEGFSRGKVKNAKVAVKERLLKDMKSFERLSNYILNEGRDYSKIKKVVYEVEKEILTGDIMVVDEMLSKISDKAYASLEISAEMYDIVTEVTSES